MSAIGQRKTILIGGRKVPGVIVGEPFQTTVEVVSRDPARAGALVRIPVTLAPTVSLRETNPALGPVRRYYAKTDENQRFSFDRTEVISGEKGEGLDYDAHGDVIPTATLVEWAMESMLEYQQARLAAAPAQAVTGTTLIPADGDDLTAAGL